MKGMWSWIKSHLWVVIFSALTLLAIPAGFVGSSMWNKSIRVAREKSVNDDFAKLKVNTTYVVDSVLPGMPKVEYSGTPNERITKTFAEWRAAQASDLKAMMDKAESINAEGHIPLIPGLFPKPEREEEMTAKVLDFAKVLMGDEQSKVPSIYDELLKAINAGGPPDAERLVESINDLRQREIDKVRTSSESQPQPLSQEQTNQIVKTLADFRMAMYQARAREISVYADRGIFFADSKDPAQPNTGVTWSTQYSSVPADFDVVDAFQAQWDLWTFRDVLLAVAKSNQDASGKPLTVEQSTVKRLERLAVQALPIYGESALSKMQAEPTATGELPLDYRRSLTGRYSSKANQQYDVRLVQLVAIVSSERLPKLIDQITKTNFMTVTNVALEKADPWQDLERGFFYGNEPIVRATLTIETIWFRSWMVPMMPTDLRYLMAVVAKEGEGEASGEAQPTTPAEGEGEAGSSRGRRDNR